MKTPLLLALFLFCSAKTVIAQDNLLINGSFEEITTCDLSWGDIEQALPCYSILDHPTAGNIYNECSTFTDLQIPENGIGNQFAADG
jgi:hypothetical protein